MKRDTTNCFIDSTLSLMTALQLCQLLQELYFYYKCIIKIKRRQVASRALAHLTPRSLRKAL